MHKLQILFGVETTVPVCFTQTHTHRHTHTHIDTHVHVHSFFLMHRFFVDRYALIFYSKFAHALKTQFQKEITVYPNMADKHIIPQNP